MRNAARYVYGLAIVVSAASPAAGQQQPNWDSVQIRTTQLTDGLYLLMGRGGNMGLSVGPDGAFLVDDQYAPLTPKILAAIAAVTREPVKFVFNTHYHGDHTGGNENLGKAGAFIVAHENVRRRMNPEEFKDVVGRTQQSPPKALPVVTFTEDVTFHWNGERIYTFHVDPAHTDGDAVVIFTRANVIHMGDVFNNGSYPFVDVPSGGTVGGIIAAADRVLAMIRPDVKIIPGHGELAGPAELRAYRDMVVAVRDRITALKKRNLTEDQVVEAKPTAEFDSKFGGNAERFVRAVYQTLPADM